jgi:hypothetical protein
VIFSVGDGWWISRFCRGFWGEWRFVCGFSWCVSVKRVANVVSGRYVFDDGKYARFLAQTNLTLGLGFAFIAA